MAGVEDREIAEKQLWARFADSRIGGRYLPDGLNDEHHLALWEIAEACIDEKARLEISNDDSPLRKAIVHELSNKASKKYQKVHNSVQSENEGQDYSFTRNRMIDGSGTPVDYVFRHLVDFATIRGTVDDGQQFLNEANENFLQRRQGSVQSKWGDYSKVLDLSVKVFENFINLQRQPVPASIPQPAMV